MEWTKIDFGKEHKGKTLPQVLFTDPDWFFWNIKNHKFGNNGPGLDREAIYLNAKARRIRIPQDKFKDHVAVYKIHQPTGKFGRLDLSTRSELVDQQSDVFQVMDVFDLSVPNQISNYDKTGNRNFLSSLKYYLFGDASYHMTKKRCEKFFEDDMNFDFVTRSEPIGVDDNT